MRDARYRVLSDEIPIYAPQIACRATLYQNITKDAANDTIPALLELQKHIKKKEITHYNNIAEFVEIYGEAEKASEFKRIFQKYGSDKGDTREYYRVYGVIAEKMNFEISTILEVGLGSNNTNIPSNMGNQGRPGASLRAFKELIGDCEIYGIDIDKNILFHEPQISTYYGDQTDFITLDQNVDIPDGIDLLIDDGLHATHANLNTLRFFLKKISIRGTIIIEDIPHKALPLWELIALMLPENFETEIIYTKTSILFLIHKNNIDS